MLTDHSSYHSASALLACRGYVEQILAETEASILEKAIRQRIKQVSSPTRHVAGPWCLNSGGLLLIAARLAARR